MELSKNEARCNSMEVQKLMDIIHFCWSDATTRRLPGESYSKDDETYLVGERMADNPRTSLINIWGRELVHSGDALFVSACADGRTLGVDRRTMGDYRAGAAAGAAVRQPWPSLA
jgi:hypothetical protein